MEKGFKCYVASPLCPSHNLLLTFLGKQQLALTIQIGTGVEHWLLYPTSRSSLQLWD